MEQYTLSGILMDSGFPGSKGGRAVKDILGNAEAFARLEMLGQGHFTKTDKGKLKFDENEIRERSARINRDTEGAAGLRKYLKELAPSVATAIAASKDKRLGLNWDKDLHFSRNFKGQLLTLLSEGFQTRWQAADKEVGAATQKDFEKRRDEMVQDTYYQGQALKQAFGRLTESIGYGTGLISNALSVSAKAMNDATKGYWIDNMRQIWGTEVKMWANPHQYRSQDDLGEMDIGSFPGRKEIQGKLADQIRKQNRMEIGALSKLPEGAPEYMTKDRETEITDIKNKNWTIGEEVLNKSSFGDSPDSTIGTMNRTIAEQAVVQRFTQLSDTTSELIAKFREWAGIPFNPNGMGGEKPEINVHVEPHVLIDGREVASRVRALNEDSGLGRNQRYPATQNLP